MHGKNYRFTTGMPYTRREYIQARPQCKIARFSLGTSNPDYDMKFELIAEEKAQIRHNALEAMRVAANKKMTTVGEAQYHLSVRVYPHVILRENKMIATAGADRLQEGMRRAFGKPIGLGARVVVGQSLLEIRTFSTHADRVKDALKSASSKLPIPTTLRATPTK